MPASAPTLFPFGEYWWFYAGFLVFVILLLALDLGFFHRKAHAVSFREAGAWALVWVSLALIFNLGLYLYMLHHFPEDPRLAAVPGFDAGKAARQTALEFLTGYVVEYSLSVDNIFVFVVVMGYFGIPAALQHRVLFFGILGALVFRAVFIALGSLLMRLEWMIWVFGSFLILTGLRFIFMPEREPNPEKNRILNAFKKYVPVTHQLQGGRFFVKLDGVVHATPLFITVLFLELTDIVFAVDSVPAIFALTREPLIVFTSNIFAILGLRNLYFLLSGAMDKFHLLKYGLGIVLVFVGLKMVWLNRLYEGHFPIAVSLGIILGVIATAIVLSLLYPKPLERAE
jgi:tellurite resistance protein TerC